MKLAGTIRSAEKIEVDAEGDDLEAARAAALTMMPSGHELVQVSTQRAAAGQGVNIHAIGRARAGTEITAEGAGYDMARASLLSQVPEGHQLLAVRVLEG